MIDRLELHAHRAERTPDNDAVELVVFGHIHGHSTDPWRMIEGEGQAVWMRNLQTADDALGPHSHAVSQFAVPDGRVEKSIFTSVPIRLEVA